MGGRDRPSARLRQSVATLNISGALVSRRRFLQHAGIALGSLTVSWRPLGDAVCPDVAAAPVLSLCADKPYVDGSGVAFRYEARGVLDAARPLMTLSEEKCRTFQPFM